jgi:hypothetical protein
MVLCMLKCYLHVPDDIWDLCIPSKDLLSLSTSSALCASNMIGSIVHLLTMMTPTNDSLLHHLHARRAKKQHFPPWHKNKVKITHWLPSSVGISILCC